MRAAIKLLFLGLLTFAAVFIVRREFFSDVMPVSWEQETPHAGALVTAYLLLTIENVAAIVAVIAFGVDVYALGQTMAGEPSVAQPIRRGGALARAWFGRRADHSVCGRGKPARSPAPATLHRHKTHTRRAAWMEFSAGNGVKSGRGHTAEDSGRRQ